ncbi:MAG: hypothetical protein JWO03_1615 [Bacteroidetes bacterium]|nr:hypothetical protein [Bacteroidota bacterium]
MSRIKAGLTILLLSCTVLASFGQIENAEPKIEDSPIIKKRQKTINNAVLINFYYSALFPVGELSNRFGFCNNIGLSVSYKMNHNWLLGVEGAYLFGSKVKENQILAPVSTSTGQFIQSSGQLGDIGLELSGFELAIRAGKVFSLSKKHPNSGIMLTLAPGFMQHKIWIRATKDSYPQFNTDYKTGYDRLTNGAMISGYLGYLYLERKKFLSFYGGVEYTVGFTQNRRAWNFFDQSGNPGGPDTHQRIDMMIGIKVGWVIPIFINKDNEQYTR